MVENININYYLIYNYYNGRAYWIRTNGTMKCTPLAGEQIKPLSQCSKKWPTPLDSNQKPAVLETAALPIELGEDWKRVSDSNRWCRNTLVFKTSSLSLSDNSPYMADEVGIEPTDHGIKTRCLTAWLFVYKKMVGSTGIEPVTDRL